MAKFKKHKKLPQENKAEDVKTEKVVKEDVEMKEDEEEDIPIPDINVVNSKIQTDEESNDDDDQEEPVLGANEDDDCDDRKHTQKVYSEEERRQREQDKDSRSIFVGNLPTSVTRRDLRKHFKSCGDIDSVRVRGVIPEKLSLSKRVASIK
jgi:RNA recognition motif-containing protein